MSAEAGKRIKSAPRISMGSELAVATRKVAAETVAALDVSRFDVVNTCTGFGTDWADSRDSIAGVDPENGNPQLYLLTTMYGLAVYDLDVVAGHMRLVGYQTSELCSWRSCMCKAPDGKLLFAHPTRSAPVLGDVHVATVVPTSAGIASPCSLFELSDMTVETVGCSSKWIVLLWGLDVDVVSWTGTVHMHVSFTMLTPKYPRCYGIADWTVVDESDTVTCLLTLHQDPHWNGPAPRKMVRFQVTEDVTRVKDGLAQVPAGVLKTPFKMPAPLVLCTGELLVFSANSVVDPAALTAREFSPFGSFVFDRVMPTGDGRAVSIQAWKTWGVSSLKVLSRSLLLREAWITANVLLSRVYDV